MHPSNISHTLLSAVSWDETLATGLPEVDEQHQKLFDITNRLSSLRASESNAEEVMQLLEDLHRYTVYHFSTEEALMGRYAISEAHRKAHKQAHQGFVRQVNRALKLAASSPNTTADLLHVFLTQWLLHHVANMDRRMSDEIHALPENADPSPTLARSSLPSETLLGNIDGVFNDLGDRTFEMLELNLQLQSEIDRRKQIEFELHQSKARFRMMADHTHSWEYWQGADGSIHYMSPSCLRVTGYTPSDFSEEPDLLYRIIHPDDRHLMEHHRTDVATHEAEDEEIGFRIIRRDGDIRWIVHSCKLMQDSSGGFIGRRGSNRDITDRQLRNDSMMLVATVFESINEAVLVTDAENRIIVVNTSFTHITGYAPEEVVGKEPGVLADEVPPSDLVMAQWNMLTAKGRWQGEMLNRRKNGELYSAAVSLDSIRDDRGEVSNFVLVFSDISERKHTERRLYQLSHHDQLTGLPNWVLFNQRLQAAVEAAADDGSHVALMFVDIDRFKQAKDRIGHDHSERLLQEFAKRLENCLQASDSAARIGSDEFVVLLHRGMTASDAAAVADQILKASAQPFVLGQHTVNIHVSIGIALYPEHGDDAGQVLKNADLAMYQSKRLGGATVRVYNPADWVA